MVERADFIASVRAGGPCDLRGVTVDGEFLAQLTSPSGDRPAPPTFDGFYADRAVFPHDVDFSGCLFTGDVTFQDATFHGEARFRQALFDCPVRFIRTHFARRADFRNARFAGDAQFGEVRFDETAIFTRSSFAQTGWFGYATWSGKVDFADAEFGGLAWFDNAAFLGEAEFSRVRFAGNASFERCKFGDLAGFAECEFAELATFTGAGFARATVFTGSHFARAARFKRVELRAEADFDQTSFDGSLSLGSVTARGRVRFDQARFADRIYASDAVFERGLWLSHGDFALADDIGPVDAGELLVLDGAAFERRVRIQVRADRVSAVDTRFADGADLQLACAEVVLDGATFSGPSSVRGARPEPGSSRTRVQSLRRVDVANLSLVEVDLGSCLFEGTHNLDKIRIEGTRSFDGAPSTPLLRIGSSRIHLGRRWSRRQTLAEEHHWRVSVGSRAWDSASTRSPPWVAERTGREPSVVTPDRVAVLYRGLRKANEDAKNEPGAADFYYGEMEMRRHAKETPLAERLVLHAYWFLSGYGLRAWRAVTLLLLVLVAHGVLFATFGISPPPGYWRGQLYALDNVLLFPDRDVVLTAVGHVFRATLRILGPLLLGLALLAIRNRVKR